MADSFDMSLTDSPWSNHGETGQDTPTPVSSSSYSTGYPHNSMLGTGDDDSFMDTTDVFSNNKQGIRQTVVSHDSLYFGGWSDDNHQAFETDGTETETETDMVWDLA